MPEFLTDAQSNQLLNGEFRSPAETARIMKRPYTVIRNMLVRNEFPNSFKVHRNHYIPMSDIRDAMTKAGDCQPMLDECQGIPKRAGRVEFIRRMPKGRQARMGISVSFDTNDAACILDLSMYQKPCIYFLLNDASEVVYVGKSVSLMTRIGTHHISGKQFSRVAVYHSSLETLDADEMRFIEKYRPPLNIVGRNGQRL